MGVQSDWGREMTPGQKHDSTDFRALAGSRHLYETVLRKFVLDVSNLKVEQDAAVDGLQFNTVKNRITGVPFDWIFDLSIYFMCALPYA